MTKMSVILILSIVCLVLLAGISFAATDTWDWSWTTGQFTTEPISPFLCLGGGNENFDGTTFNIGVSTSTYQIGSLSARTQDASCNNRLPIIIGTAHDGFYSGETIPANQGITIQWNMLLDGTGPNASSDTIPNFGYAYIGAMGDIGVYFSASSVWFGPGVALGSHLSEVESQTFSVNTDTYHTWRFVVPPGSTGGTAMAELYKDGVLLINWTAVSTYTASYSDFPRFQWGNVATYGYAGNPPPDQQDTHMWFTDMRIEAGAWDPSHNAVVPVELSKFHIAE